MGGPMRQVDGTSRESDPLLPRRGRTSIRFLLCLASSLVAVVLVSTRTSSYATTAVRTTVLLPDVEDTALREFGNSAISRNAISELTETSGGAATTQATLKPISDEEFKMYNRTQITGMIERRLAHVGIELHRTSKEDQLKAFKKKLDNALTKIKDLAK